MFKFEFLFTKIRSDFQSSDVEFGAWWLGFLVAATLGMLVSLPTCMFPRDTEAGKVNRLNRSKEMHSNDLALKLENMNDDEKSYVCFLKNYSVYENSTK